MNIFKKKPGVVILPVSAVFIIFIALLFLLIGQRQSNNALVLEYKASRLINIMLDLYVNGQDVEPAEIDDNIIGYGVYDNDGVSVDLYGTAPENLPRLINREKIIYTGNKSIIIIRKVNEELPSKVNEMMRHGSQNMMGRQRELRGGRSEDLAMMPMVQKYQSGIYLEYSNSSYIAERLLIMLITILFILIFAAAFILLLRLYKTNQKLLVKTEHDKQLIQLGEAARTLAHEIRNPLSTLKIQRDLLSRKLSSEYNGNLEVIDRELRRLNVLVERVGDFLRNPVGRPESVILASFIDELYGGREELQLETGCSETAVFFDRERLRTVLDNVVNNAVDSGGAAVIRIKVSGRNVNVEVEDHGPGFSDEAQSRLFDPFFTTKNSGTGLGLSIVKRLMDSSGGSVKIVNLKTGGAVVILAFGESYESSDSR